MSERVLVVEDGRFPAYDFGPAHPMSPIRLQLAFALAHELGVLDGPPVTVVGATPATETDLLRVHSPAYLEAVRRNVPDPRHGLGTSDNPVFPGMYDATALAVGASLVAARAVADGTAQHAVNLAGGLHHAMRDAAAGFCIFNDPAVAIADLLARGVERIAYVDVDVHHGDGVEAAFADEPRVLTISLHETGRTLFPGTGHPHETGTSGTSVNVALPPRTGDRDWLAAFDRVVPPLVRAFRPEVLVSQQGCDTHQTDPLAHLALTVDGQRASYLRLHDLAHEVCDGRWVAVGGGGYQRAYVVPRAWTHLLAIAAGRPVDPATPTPERWRALVTELTGEEPAETMGDGADLGWVTYSAYAEVPGPAGEAIDATREAVFPFHGLRP